MLYRKISLSLREGTNFPPRQPGSPILALAPQALNDPTFHQPCYSLNIGPAQLWAVDFGNFHGVRAASEGAITPDEPAMNALMVKNVDDESYEDDGSFVDPRLHRPAQGINSPLFLPQISH